MSTGRSYPKMLIVLVFAMVVLAALALLVVQWATQSRGELPVWSTLPEFAMTAAHSNEPFGTNQMKGKLTLVDFIFTGCRGACPIMADHYSQLYELYRGSDKVQFVSISVDPDRDSLPVLRQYAASLGVTDDSWVFLSAPVDSIIALCEEGFMLPADDLPIGHTTVFTLIDQDGNIRNYYDGLDEGILPVVKADIRQLTESMP